MRPTLIRSLLRFTKTYTIDGDERTADIQYARPQDLRLGRTDWHKQYITIRQVEALGVGQLVKFEGLTFKVVMVKPMGGDDWHQMACERVYDVGCPDQPESVGGGRFWSGPSSGVGGPAEHAVD